MILKNADIFDSEFALRRADVRVEDGKIAEIGENLNGGEEHDLSGCVILPGFIDIHIHGCGGADFSDAQPDTLETMSRTLASFGVTSFCPASMTLPYDRIVKAFENAAGYLGKECGAYIHGINMEGPFISPAKKGAQAEEYIIAPDYNTFAKLNAVCPVKLVDVAPEIPGALDFAEQASKVCTVSAAHTTATYEQAKAGYEHGFSHATHLFNAMVGLGSREAGTVGAVMDSSTVTAELICDGIHISAPTLRIAFRILGEDRIAVISDATMAAGLEDGEYTLGGQRVIKKGAVRLPDGTLAGSAANLFDEFNNLLRFGIPLRSALKAVTINPARIIGADNTTGSIAVGKSADLLIVSDDFSHINNVIIKGKQFSAQ